MSTYDTAYDLAAAAKVVLENKALQLAFENLERQYYQQFLDTKADETETLRAIKGRQDSLAAFKADLEATVQGAQIASFNTKSRKITK